MEYRYSGFSRKLLMEDMAFLSGPKPGESLPDFELTTTEGGRVRKGDYVGKKPLLISVGSVTCPMTASSIEPLKRLYSQFGNQVDFLSVYVREAHPGNRYPQPESFEQKLKFARDLRERDQIPWPVAVDDIEGSFHQALDSKPNSAYLIDIDGNVAFRSLWSDNERSIRKAIMSLLSGQRPVGQSRKRMAPMMKGVGKMYEMLERSGPKAKRDVLTQAPPIYLLARTASFFRPLSPLGRSLAAMMLIGIVTSAIVSGVRGLNRA